MSLKRLAFIVLSPFALRLSPSAFSLLVVLVLAQAAQAARIKDICTVEGMRDNQLIGYGVVVGLTGTGDGTGDDIGLQTLVTFLKRNNIQMDIKSVKPKNVAAVVVTATLPPFARQGTRIDVNVASIGDATDLHGGTLLAAPLRPVSADPNAPASVYAVAQGPISTGDYSAGTSSGGGGASAAVVKNHPTAGTIPNGAIIEREVETAFATKPEAVLQLRNPDFTTADRIAQIVNATVGAGVAKARDAANVAVALPAGGTEARVQFLSQIENLQVSPNVPARVVYNERTGTIVMGGDVRITSAIVTHGNLIVQTKASEESAVAQQMNENTAQQMTVKKPKADVKVTEERGKFEVIDEGVTIGEVAKALNALGVTARDIISVLQALKECGALQADLVAM